jgi:hypothetical protein
MSSKLLISINGSLPKEVKNVVIYMDNIPIAAAMQAHNSIYYADASRDQVELRDILKTVGAPSPAQIHIMEQLKND